MALFVLSTYTALITTTNLAFTTPTALLPPHLLPSQLTPSDLATRIHGSKLVLIVEQLQIAVIWSCKACLLILYHRLTHLVSPIAHLAIKLLALYTLLSLLVMELLFFTLWCRPFSQYWAIPPNNPKQCGALTHHLIINAISNISSDVIMLAIALPMFIRSLLPLKRKLVLSGIFSLGFFVVLAAVLNKYFSLREGGRTAENKGWLRWYVRESSTAVLVANLPFTWTLLRKGFGLGAFDEERVTGVAYHSSRSAGGRRAARGNGHGNTLQSRNMDTMTGTGYTARTEKYATQTGSMGTAKGGGRSVSLISSLCGRKETHEKDVEDNSQLSDKGLLTQAPVSIPSRVVLSAEHGHENAIPTLSSKTKTPHSRSTSNSTSPSSPTSPHRAHHAHMTADGTGGFHLTSHRHAHFNDTHESSPNHNPVYNTIRGRSLSPSVMRDSRGAMGGGRSAKDRRVRARMNSTS
jgi:hypothetical protein